MRIALTIVGSLFGLVGIVWFFQGVGLLPGSFMTGQSQWAIYGGLIFVVGVGFIFLGNRRKAVPPQE